MKKLRGGWFGVVGVIAAGLAAYAQPAVAQQVAAQIPGQPDLQKLRQLVAANPGRLDLLLGLGDAAAGGGAFDVALDSFHKVLDNLEPESRLAAELHLKIGETYRLKGDNEAAVAWLWRASELLPDEPAALGSLAMALDAAGHPREAVAFYRSTLQLDPENVVALNNFAFLLAEQGEQLDQALGMAQRAMALAPGDADIIDTAGWVQWKRNQPPAATGLFARALGHEPGNPGYRKHLLMVLDGIDSADGPWAELKSLLSGDATAANVVRVAELLKMLEGAGDTK